MEVANADNVNTSKLEQELRDEIQYTLENCLESSSLITEKTREYLKSVIQKNYLSKLENQHFVEITSDPNNENSIIVTIKMVDI